MRRLDKAVTVLFLAAILAISADLLNIFFNTPIEASQGLVQKIFYVHVPSAFNMYIGFAIGFIYSVAYLIKRKEEYDVIAYSGIEVGFVFAICVLLSGPLWAKATWGRFWDFDPRLTSTLIIWFVYFSYILLRKYYGDGERGKLFAAVIAIIGFLDAPIIHYSVRLWRGIHPNVIWYKTQGGLPGSMKMTLAFSALCFVILFAFVFALKLKREYRLMGERRPK